LLATNEKDLLTGAIFSDDGKRRYSLWRFWNYQATKNGKARAVMFIMANPSTAGAYKNDQTIFKCAKYAQKWGYDGMYIGNLFSIIMTHWLRGEMPEEQAIGEENNYWLDVMKNSSAIHIAAWGFMGDYHPERAKAVRDMFPALHHLGISLDGQPKHPLYLPGDCEPTLWEGEK